MWDLVNLLQIKIEKTGMSVKLILNSATNSNFITKYENCRNYTSEVKSSFEHKLVKVGNTDFESQS